MHLLNIDLNESKQNQEPNPLELSEKEMDVLYLARYFYKYDDSGKEFIPDAVYQKLMDKLEAINSNHILITRLWSDDPIPYDLLNKYNIPVIKISNHLDLLPLHIQEMREKYKTQIEMYAQDLLNRSINLVRTDKEISKWFLTTPYKKFHGSVKADGINYSATYVHGELIHVITRSRDGSTGIDISWQGRLLLPNKIETKEDILKVSGEIVLPPMYLPYFRSKYDKPYKTARNSVNSVLLTCPDEEDIKKLTALSFKVKCDSLHSLEEEFIWMQSNGFTVPPWTTFNYNGSYSCFESVFSQFEPLRRILPYGSDGFVVAVNDNDQFYSLGGTATHFNGNIACKIGVWDATNYKSVVVGITWTYNTTKITPVLIIEPVETITGQTVTHINAHHIQRLLDLGITIGSEVSFNYVSDCYVELVY
ncbi:hypothetical protein [Clostridium tertium]|uniref:hypothetical protein n=1 Tax=Clostridium tertium TaxID=1559 RepID=UPI0023B314A7|nr:hypothetical protein [Clostridium tertium]